MQKDDSLDSHAPSPVHPLDIMRQTYVGMEFQFKEDDGKLVLRLTLQNVEVVVFSWGEPEDVAGIIVRLPIRAAEAARARTGEFLHRLNFPAKRKFWEMDYDDGEIRLAIHTDTLLGPLTEKHFCGLLHCLLKTADHVFPYLTNVLSGAMRPDLAADQALAALEASSKRESETD